MGTILTNTRLAAAATCLLNRVAHHQGDARRVLGFSVQHTAANVIEVTITMAIGAKRFNDTYSVAPSGVAWISLDEVE
jgi:hypothetical protein